jgi:histidinol-phosphate aminotransferase
MRRRFGIITTMSHADRQPTRLIRDLPADVPFVGPEALERRMGRPFRVRVGANESAFGPSPAARQAMAAAIAGTGWYGDPESYDLREALADRLGTTRAHVAVGSGIDDLLGLIARAYLEQGDVAVTSLGAYPTFNYHVQGFGGRLRFVPYRDCRNDVEALAEAAREADARVLYLANPDNPTGTWHPAAAVERLLDALPEGCLLALDEAYHEFAPEDTVPDLDPSDPRLVRLRTFSKAHGMAGARIGYAVASEPVIGAFERIRHHFGVNRVAQAGALASLGDEAFIAHVASEVTRGRLEYEDLAAGLGLDCLPSATNFVAIDCLTGAGSEAAVAALAERGVFVRRPRVAPLDRYVRVTVGDEADRAAFAEAFTAVAADLGLSRPPSPPRR